MFLRIIVLIHQNHGIHLDGGIPDDARWQHLYWRIMSVLLPLYYLPSGVIANRFLLMQTQLLRDVRKRRCNSEKALIFAPCILQKVQSKKLFRETKPLISGRLNAWEVGRDVALSKDVEDLV